MSAANTISTRLRDALPPCPASIVELALDQAKGLYGRLLTKLSDSENLSSGGFSKILRCEPQGSSNCLQLEFIPLFERTVEKVQKNAFSWTVWGDSYKEVKRIAELTTKVSQPKSTLNSFFFGDSQSLIHRFWAEGSGDKICESLGAANSREVFTKCYESTGSLEKLPLLSEVCTWTPSIEQIKSLEAPSYSFLSAFQVVKCGVGTVALLKAAQNLRAKGTVNKVRGCAWAVFSAAAFASTIY